MLCIVGEALTRCWYAEYQDGLAMMFFQVGDRMKLDLNCDVGELNSEVDDRMLQFVSSCNVCCGAHAGSLELIKSTIKSAVRMNVAIGAHPSWPDRGNFGRQTLDLPTDQLAKSIRQQIELVCELADLNSTSVKHVKPHGALYHDVSKQPELAEMLIDVTKSIDSGLMIYGMADSAFAQTCVERQVDFVHEVFADRRYENATTLRSRKNSNALIVDQDDFRTQIQSLIAGKVVVANQESYSISVQSICLHGDTPNAATWAELARQILEEQNVQIEAP